MKCVFCGGERVVQSTRLTTCLDCSNSVESSHAKLLGFVTERVAAMSDPLLDMFIDLFDTERQRRDARSPSKDVELVTHVHPPRRNTTPFMKSIDGLCTIKFVNGLLTILHQDGGGAEPGERGFEFDPLHFIQEFGLMMLRGGYKSPNGEVSVNLGTSPFSTPPSFLEIKISDQSPIWVSASDFDKFLKDLKSIYGNSD